MATELLFVPCGGFDELLLSDIFKPAKRLRNVNFHVAKYAFEYVKDALKGPIMPFYKDLILGFHT